MKTRTAGIVLFVFLAVASAGAFMAPHVCHLEALVDWSVNGYLERTGIQVEDPILLVRLDDGCTCIMFLPEWVGLRQDIPRKAWLHFRGITLKDSENNEKPVMVALEITGAL